MSCTNSWSIIFTNIVIYFLQITSNAKKWQIICDFIHYCIYDINIIYESLNILLSNSSVRGLVQCMKLVSYLFYMITSISEVIASDKG